MEQNNFLQDFEASINKLKVARENIQKTTQFRENFTNNLKTKLSSINKAIQELAGKITDLKRFE